MRVQVTAEDIEAGVPNDCKRCPVVRALNRVTGCDDWRYDLSFAWRESGATAHVLSRAVGERAYAYDLTGHMEPFRFEMGGYDEGRERDEAGIGSDEPGT